MGDIDINGEYRKLQIQQYLINLVKLIPAEILALYTISMSFTPATLVGALFVAIPLMIITPLYLVFAMGVKSPAQVIVSTVAFAAWLFALGGPFIYFSWYQPWMAGTILTLFTIIPPILFGKPMEVEKTTATKSGAKSKKKINTKAWRQI